MAVVERATGERRLLIDNIFVAGDHPVMLNDQKSLAHFPSLLHPDPSRVLTIGFGSGGASYSFTLFDEVSEVKAVEIAQEVLHAARFFPRVNYGVLRHPKFEVILDDARSYLSLSRGQGFDVITSDCTDLSYRANADLYQREFFETCRRRLNPGGLMCVWLPLRHLSREDFASAVGSFRQSFPHGTLWYMVNMPSHYVLLIGGEEPLAIDFDRMASRMSRPAIANDLAEIGLDEPIRLASCLLLDSEGLAAVTRDAPPHTEDHPRLEFTVPRYSRGLEREFENLEEMLPHRVPLASVLPGLAAEDPRRVEAADIQALALTEGHIEMLKSNLVGAYRRYVEGLWVEEASDLRRQVRVPRYRRVVERLEPSTDLALDRGHLAWLDGRLEEAAASYEAVEGVERLDARLGLALSRGGAATDEGRRLLGEVADSPEARPQLRRIARYHLNAVGDVTAPAPSVD